MEHHNLKTLVAVIETGSFSLAASQLSVTQSAVSHRIKSLEERYGKLLIDRSGPILVPTAAGSVALKYSEQIIRLEEELTSELDKLGKKSRLALCATPASGTLYLPKIMKSFLDQVAESVDLRFILLPPEQALKGLRSNEYDLGVIEHNDNLNLIGLLTYPLPEDEMVFICHTPLCPEEGELSLNQILQERIMARSEFCSCRQLLDANLKKFGHTIADFKSTIINDDLSITLQAVVEGNGIAFVSRDLAAAAIEHGDVSPFRVHGFYHKRLRTIVVQPSKQHDPHIRYFIENLYGAFSLSPPEYV